MSILQNELSKLEASQSSSAEAREQAIAEAERAAAMARKHAAAQKAAKAKTWSEEEVRMLEKALAKFPQVTLTKPSKVKDSCIAKLHQHFTEPCRIVHSPVVSILQKGLLDRLGHMFGSNLPISRI